MPGASLATHCNSPFTTLTTLATATRLATLRRADYIYEMRTVGNRMEMRAINDGGWDCHDAVCSFAPFEPTIGMATGSQLCASCTGCAVCLKLDDPRQEAAALLAPSEQLILTGAIMIPSAAVLMLLCCAYTCLVGGFDRWLWPPSCAMRAGSDPSPPVSMCVT